ncbi:hypothetical protein P3T35_007385 [Kitasatospora sp. GP30]|nr:hypothetical protein [Kitasatospora sp. GP30]
MIAPMPATPVLPAPTVPLAVADGTVGDFETHITVECAADDLGRLAGWARDRSLKFTHIVLARGRMVSQPMVTLRGSAALARHRAQVAAAVHELRTAGFRPVRVKVEAAPWVPGVPGSDAESAALGPGVYFEHHIKVVLDPADQRAELAARVASHGAHVSWNARRSDGRGREQRFVTQRCHGVGLPAAGRALERLVAVIRGSGIAEVLSVEREFVVFDGNLSVDEGWIEEGTS